jgi:hypothetical protein
MNLNKELSNFIIIIIVIIIAISLIGTIFWQSKKIEKTGNLEEKSKKNEDWEVYINKDYNFKIEYPSIFELTENNSEKEPPIGFKNLFKEEENKKIVARLLDKGEITETKSIVHFEIQIAVSQPEDSFEQCINTNLNLPTSNEKILQERSEEYIKKGFTKTKKINGTTFYRRLRYGGMAMGGAYTESDGFSTIYNNQCYEITAFMYTSIKLPEDFSYETFFRILDTFEFLD